MEIEKVYKTYKHLAASGRSLDEIAASIGWTSSRLQSFVATQKDPRLQKPGRPTTAPIVDGEKVCTKCKQSRPLTAYDRNSSKPGGIVAQCKTCARPPKPSPLDKDPHTFSYRQKIWLDGVESVKQDLGTLNKKIIALRADLEASKHERACLVRALATPDMDDYQKGAIT